MAEQPASVAREAKSIHQSLKELLKTKEPFDKEVDFQRKNLRRRYLNLLLIHPNAKESQDVENHLWMQTSYAFISSYKQRVATLDRSIQNAHRQQAAAGQSQGQPARGNSQHGVVEHRKLIQRFRQFLADEEKFWTQLVLRLRRMFDLTEAQPALLALGLMDNVSTIAETDGRNHFQFPPEDPSVSFLPATPEERQSRLAILSKALICLGDIARYRELYNENSGKREDGRRGRNRRGGGAAVDNPPRPKNYTKAQQCYEQARLLVPSDGNPSHQLAILASYKKDSFASLIHYYRALCVSQPYDTAAENLGTVLSKALETWRGRMKRERERNSQPAGAPSVRVRTENLQESIVVLHALWRLGMDKGIEKMRAMSPRHDEKVAKEFYAMVSERHLSPDTISNIIVLSQGALWKHRMIRHTPAPHGRNHQPITVPAGTSTLIEWNILKHLLDLHTNLLEVGKDELKDLPSLDGLDDLAQRITATFRRTLPALRIASKWLRANVNYLAQDIEFPAAQEKTEAGGQDKGARAISALSLKTRLFWETYAQFILALSVAFPAKDLPAFDAPLEEDMDMRGFLPLKKLMGEEKNPANEGKSPEGSVPREQVHPNVEQLMRIADLLDDAHYLASMEKSPLLLLNNHVVFNPDSVEMTSSKQSDIARADEESAAPVRPKPTIITTSTPIVKTKVDENHQEDEYEDDNVDNMSLPEDDPVNQLNAVFNDVLDRPELMDQDDEEDDEIVWDPRANVASPALSPNTRPVTFTTPQKPLISPQALSPRSPTLYQSNKSSSFNIPAAPLPPPAATTAQDLLHGFLSPKPRELPFGNNIWSASSDEKPLMFNGSGGSNMSGGHSANLYQTSPRQFQAVPGPSQDLSQQSTWMSQYPSQSQNSQQNYAGTLPSASFARPPQMMLSSSINIPRQHIPQQQQQHHRIPSAPAADAYLFAQNSNVQPHDPFAYSHPVPQQLPIHRPQPTHGFSSAQYQGPVSTFRGHGAPPGQYFSNSTSAFHSKQLSMHDPRVSQQNYLSPPMSQVWSNTG